MAFNVQEDFVDPFNEILVQRNRLAKEAIEREVIRQLVDGRHALLGNRLGHLHLEPPSSFKWIRRNAMATGAYRRVHGKYYMNKPTLNDICWLAGPDRAAYIDELERLYKTLPPLREVYMSEDTW